jgi:hypothetical protein
MTAAVVALLERNVINCAHSLCFLAWHDSGASDSAASGAPAALVAAMQARPQNARLADSVCWALDAYGAAGNLGACRASLGAVMAAMSAHPSNADICGKGRTLLLRFSGEGAVRDDVKAVAPTIHLEMLQRLPRLRDDEKNALRAAALSNNVDGVRDLLDRGADMHWTGPMRTDSGGNYATTFPRLTTSVRRFTLQQ